MTVGEAWGRAPVTVVVGVDGSGRTRRLEAAGAVAGGEVVRVGVGSRPGPALDALLTRAAAGATVLVDDAHRLGDGVLRALLDEVRSGTVMVLARRPSIRSAELADLDAEPVPVVPLVPLVPLVPVELELHPAIAPAASNEARIKPDRRQESMPACWHVRTATVRQFARVDSDDSQ